MCLLWRNVCLYRLPIFFLIWLFVCLFVLILSCILIVLLALKPTLCLLLICIGIWLVDLHPEGTSTSLNWPGNCTVFIVLLFILEVIIYTLNSFKSRFNQPSLQRRSSLVFSGGWNHSLGIPQSTFKTWGVRSSNTYKLRLKGHTRADFLLGAWLWGFPACCGEGFLYDLSLCTLFVPLAQESRQNNSPDWPESGKKTFLFGFSVKVFVFPSMIFFW